VIQVYDADSGDIDREESNDDEGIPKQGSGVLAFLEDKTGKVISHCEKKRLYGEMQGFWNDNINLASPPDNWSSAGASLRDKFQDILEEKFPFLRLCAGRWKVEVLWKKNYHSWKRSFLARQAKKTGLDSGDSNDSDGTKRKRKESPEPMDPYSDTGEMPDVPRLKKVKTGTSFVPSMSQSQKVRQLTADAHLIIRRVDPNTGFTYRK